MALTVWHPSAKRQQLEDAGTFTGGGHKFLVHTTEGTTLEGVFTTVKVKRSAPHSFSGSRTASAALFNASQSTAQRAA